MIMIADRETPREMTKAIGLHRREPLDAEDLREILNRPNDDLR